jgi:cell division protein FtsI/penicillin-binding protein 2
VVDVATAFADNCLTGFARAASALSGEQLRDAGTALGIGLADATGAGGFDGLLPPTDDDLLRVQNAVGEGAVLASPLVMARAAATVATGVARPSRLVAPLNGAATEPAGEPTLSGSEQATLQQLMALSVQTDEQLAPLRTASAGRVQAVAGTAGYGPAAGADSHAWCIGYQGSLAFAVFVAGDPATAATDVYRARAAAQVAADFLG